MSRTSLGKTSSTGIPPRRGTRQSKALGIIALAMLAAGCSTTLEDGYKPKALGASPDIRKSYYASPFTDSAESGARESGPSFRPGR